MGALILMLALTNILLVVGIVGTVIGITHLVYPSRGRRHRQRKRDRNTRQHREPDEENPSAVERRNDET
jgi:FtsZ-interacting cell division protein ZipA